MTSKFFISYLEPFRMRC
uniref:Uncharacterized protein n=1 Tax=Anguilla anguilla TaxID=7936 RepID=A0A0E9QAR5_ANGAN